MSVGTQSGQTLSAAENGPDAASLAAPIGPAVACASGAVAVVRRLVPSISGFVVNRHWMPTLICAQTFSETGRKPLPWRCHARDRYMRFCALCTLL